MRHKIESSPIPISQQPDLFGVPSDAPRRRSRRSANERIKMEAIVEVQRAKALRVVEKLRDEGCSIETVAEHTSISKYTIWHWVTGRTPPSFDSLCRLEEEGIITKFSLEDLQCSESSAERKTAATLHG